MTTIYVRTVLEALDRAPGTIHDLATETGYPAVKVMSHIIEARMEGHSIVCRPSVGGGTSTYEHEEECRGKDSL